MVERALTSLQMMVHRSGSVDGEGDGSGLLVDLPAAVLATAAGARGPRPRRGRRPALHGRPHLLRHRRGRRGPGAAHRGDRRASTASRCSGAARARSTAAALGPRASETPPIFWQIACLASEPGGRGLHQLLPGHGAASSATLDCHVASFSANDAVYKVQGQPEVIPRFYPEMAEADFASSRIIAHNRYSTNTYPTFSRVQPFSILGHNGEINTIAQLREQSEQLGLPITRVGSDSQDLNRLLEGLIFEKGLSLLEAVEFALPPILGEVHRLPAKLQDLYVHYREALGPYAQGPVGLACRAADEMVFAVDAMGLRPLWWIETDEIYVVSSEPGIVPGGRADPRPGPARPRREGGPGHRRRRRAAWCSTTGSSSARSTAGAKGRGALPSAETRARLAGGLDPVAVEEIPDEELPGRSSTSTPSWPRPGWIESDKQQLQFHADRGAEPIGSLGWDGPLGPVHARARCRSPTTSRRRSRSSPTRRSTASARWSTSPRASCSAAGPRSRASSPSRRSAASCACRSSSAGCAAAPRPCRCPSCAAWPWARAWPAWRTCSPPGTGARRACPCTSPQDIERRAPTSTTWRRPRSAGGPERAPS